VDLVAAIVLPFLSLNIRRTGQRLASVSFALEDVEFPLLFEIGKEEDSFGS